MEIIAEILLQVLGLILQILGELLLQLVFEALAELIGHGIKEPLRRRAPIPPSLAAIGYPIYGAIAGALSLWVMPGLFIKAGWLRMANLVITPIIAGFLMAIVGSWRRKRDKRVIRLETLGYGFCFAFFMALVRYVFGR